MMSVMGGKKRGKAIPVAPPRVPTPMPPPKENLYSPYYRVSSTVVGSDASYRLSAAEMEALNAVKSHAPKMDKNGYFSYITSTAKKKKISLMQSKPPRVAFAGSELTWRPSRDRSFPVGGFAASSSSVAPAAAHETRAAGPMSQRAASSAPRARVDYAQLECYQPRYHHIREQVHDVKRGPVYSATQDYSARGSLSGKQARRPAQRVHQPLAHHQPPAQAPTTSSRSSKNSHNSPHRRRRGAASGNTEDDGGSAPSGFCAALQKVPPPPPPALLRRLGVKEATGVGKVKVMLRVAGAGEGPFSNGSQTFTLDKRKKQVTLYEAPAAGAAAAAPEDRKVGVAAPKMFAFDAIFSQDDSQTEICSSALTDVIHAVINGTDGCLFCFGHAGLGKSYTMLGRADAPGSLGAMPCAISWLFRGISEQRHKCGTRFSVRVSAVELCTNTNQMRDLLAPYHNDSEQSPGVYLRDDPLFGTHLQNHSELRVHSAEKAAFYLDAALATRIASREEGKDSHLLYTLHVYQCSVGGKGAVAGGRSRLHLIDLGNSDRGKLSGGIPLSGLGNILLAIFNGQRHLPYRDHNLTHVLRECLGSLTCHTAMIVHVSPKDQNYTDTLTTLQLASRIHRLRRRKMKFPTANNAGSGGSSGEDAKPSSSEPDPSSSDLSADTVIYMGPLDDATDGEHPPVYIPHINSGDNRGVMSKALRGSLAEQKHKSSLGRVAEEKSPIHKLHTSPKSSPLKVIPSHMTGYSTKCSPTHSAKSSAFKKVPLKQMSDECKTKSPLHQTTANASTSEEQWIDGPRISKSKLVEARHIIHEAQQIKKRETWIDGPMQAGAFVQQNSGPIPSNNGSPQQSATHLQTSHLPTVPLQAGQVLLQMGLLTSQGNENLGYGYMDNHKKSMIRKWVENQTSQMHKSRNNSPTHRAQQPQYKELTQFKTCDDMDNNSKIEPPIKNVVKVLHVEESKIRTGLKAGSKAIGIEEENADAETPEQLNPSRRSMTKKPLNKHDIDEDDDSEELAEIPPALPLIQQLSSREVSMESLDSRLKQRLRMNDDIVSNHSRDIDYNGMSKGPTEEEDEILEIIEVEEPLEPVPTQDSCLQVTEEDIAFCMGYAQNPLPEVDQSDSEEHPLRILSQENLTVVSTFTDSLSLYSDVERQIRSDAYLRRALDLYCADFECTNLLGDVDPFEAEASSRSRLDDLLGLRELYRSHVALAVADETVSVSRNLQPPFQSLSMSNVRETEEFRGDGSVYSEPAYRPSEKICDSCKRTMSRPNSAADHRGSYRNACDPCNDTFGPFEMYHESSDAKDARIASLRHPDGASDPNLREERRTPGSGAPAPPYREVLKASLHLEVAAAPVSTEPRGLARVNAGVKPDGYDSGHESTPRTGKHSPAATSRRAESGYDSVPRDSDASSLDSYPTRRAAAAASAAKRATAAKYKQHHDRSFCSWLRNPFTCKYADTDPEISDF